MAEYVTKEQVLGWFRPYGHMDEPIPFETMVSDLRGMPAADVAPVRHGQWIPIPEYENKRCSVCGIVFSSFTLGYYCPHCGAKMDGDGS